MKAICVLMLMLNGQPVSKQVEGKVIQMVGDVWVMDFSKALNRYKQFKTDKQVKAINSNACLLE